MLQAQKISHTFPSNKIDFIDGFLVVAVRQRLIYTKVGDLLDLESYAGLDEEQVEQLKEDNVPTGRCLKRLRLVSKRIHVLNINPDWRLICI